MPTVSSAAKQEPVATAVAPVTSVVSAAPSTAASATASAAHKPQWSLNSVNSLELRMAPLAVRTTELTFRGYAGLTDGL